VDLVILNPDGSANWDLKQYAKLSDHLASVALRRGTPLEWGGNWKTLRDGPHFQLPFASYPK
jgi:peptidoglycan L-alanyl-D-glutamate endopeptidase CwlK